MLAAPVSAEVQSRCAAALGQQLTVATGSFLSSHFGELMFVADARLQPMQNERLRVWRKASSTMVMALPIQEWH